MQRQRDARVVSSALTVYGVIVGRAVPLAQVITPPTVGWEQYMEEAFESGALEAITAVLKKHRGDPDVLAASTACLSSLATNPQCVRAPTTACVAPWVCTSFEGGGGAVALTVARALAACWCSGMPASW